MYGLNSDISRSAGSVLNSANLLTVLSVSANHEHAHCTVCVDRNAVMGVAVTQEHTAMTGNVI